MPGVFTSLLLWAFLALYHRLQGYFSSIFLEPSHPTLLSYLTTAIQEILTNRFSPSTSFLSFWLIVGVTLVELSEDKDKWLSYVLMQLKCSQCLRDSSF